jgi:hypothetical protein
MVERVWWSRGAHLIGSRESEIGRGWGQDILQKMSPITFFL